MLTTLLVVGLLYTAIAILYHILPAPLVNGYAKDGHGKRLQYKLPGFRCLLIVEASFLILGWLGVIQPTYLADNSWAVFASTCLIGFVMSVYFYWRKEFPVHVTAPKLLRIRSRLQPDSTMMNLTNFFLGYELNPRFLQGGFDFKMYLYVVGAIMLQLNILSFAWLSVRHHGLTSALVVYCFEFTWFITEYLYFEHVHLYTYDLIDENVGFKLVWGCLCFYPEFYMCGVFPFGASSNVIPHSTDSFRLPLSIICFFGGWILTRGANLQKYHFKTKPNEPWFGIRAESIGESLLVSGFWGLARHVNYLGEILQGIGLALPTLHLSLVALLYPLYYVGLMIARERDDDERCAHKYGPLWQQYCARVPYRIIPFVY